RFPGGRDVDYIDWRDMIDHVPGREGGRPASRGPGGKPLTNRFGLEEYFELRDRLGNETILVVNFLDAVSRKLPLEEAALNAAGLVAYANAPAGEQLPDGMPDWPAVRARNGHFSPHHADYIQIGNEYWWWPQERLVSSDGKAMAADQLAEWFLECLKAYIRAIRNVDPSVKIIVDGEMPMGAQRTVLADPDIRREVEFIAHHHYEPGPMNWLRWHDEPITADRISADDWWRAWTAMPGRYSPAGKNLSIGHRADFARSLGYRIAVTEWNWNGWAVKETQVPASLDWRDRMLAAGIGAAGFLNGLMRSDVAIAAQSVLVGTHWSITSIHVDAAAPEPAYFLPQGHVTRLYSEHHGEERLKLQTSPLPVYEQPLAMGWMKRASGTVAGLDLVATRGPETVYLHAVNRHAEQAFPVAVDMSDFPLRGTAVRYRWGAKQKSPSNGGDQIGEITASDLLVTERHLRTVLPAKSVTVIAVDLAKNAPATD
ncbi:MAG TPA: hypothetical protein VKA18_11295, partial [Alphaproteobacteria bacterium]|nr:hypothetical protein [Alphaproteobacteria bacterium]